eukprot:CAMPEP_0184870346 /NCGR_PEP_ID=MMETSP0580-20130426/37177_1 /TAXON_ID=1118495 /ORGANISM="Dactyliosolen fragilissimus" /LENGTH=32 /DNA_ID= /DNA_START= /DNA_END= /DNA_ORIENTATION=
MTVAVPTMTVPGLPPGIEPPLPPQHAQVIPQV